ncbi:TIGR03862 family flavoprotein [bacterium SCSIO 12643]|nr:TIGR03862 family flavoprotein [bacterium SCSIO 12643]
MGILHLLKKPIKKIAIIGGGSACFVAADILSQNHEVIIYEKGKTIGRKFLVAGKGGFNISHQIEIEELIQKYTPSEFLAPMLNHFDVKALRAWYSKLGIDTYVGSSSRIFPEKGISPADVLRQIKRHLLSRGVTFKYEQEFIGFSENVKPVVKSPKEEFEIQADHYLFCLGGASWKVTGSDGLWLSYFKNIGVSTLPFAVSNCGLNVDWPTSISEFHIGKPLKNIKITHGSQQIKGEAVISEYGLEGNAIYPISTSVRNTLTQKSTATIQIDFKPSLSTQDIQRKIRNQKPSNYGKTLKLNSHILALVKTFMSKEEYISPSKFSEKIKALEIPIHSLRPIEEAISTVGGIDIHALDTELKLKKHPHLMCLGEMVNWDAPTGGFLLQGCFSMSAWAARAINLDF